MAKGKKITFDKNAKLDDCLEAAKDHWLATHTKLVSEESGEREFIGNNKYTPFQARRGDELLIFVWGGGTLKMFREIKSVEVGPRQVW